MKFDINIIKKWNYNDKNSYNQHLNRYDKFLRIKQSIGENWFFEVYDEDNLEGSIWKEVVFNFSASNIQLTNDSADVFLFSWEGNNIDGILMPGENLGFSQLERAKIYLKMKGKIRIWAY